MSNEQTPEIVWLDLSEKEKAERLDSIKQTQKEIQINQSKDKKK